MLKTNCSVILNVYKRPHMLNRQIEAILDQTIGVEPEDIHVWYNPSGVFQDIPKNRKVNTYASSWNTKFFGRFTIPMLCRTDYIAVFDDDNIPMPGWFESCLNVINEEETNGILGGVGITILSKETYKKSGVTRLPIENTGWNGYHLDETVRVDYVGQTWFFRREWAKYMWWEDPVTWDNGEDIMFSYLSQKYGGINTFVPPHPEGVPEIWSTDFKTAWDAGRDSNASWRKKEHTPTRDLVHLHCIDNGWKTVHGL